MAKSPEHGLKKGSTTVMERIKRKLMDGRRHSLKELNKLLYDPEDNPEDKLSQTTRNTLHNYISRLRKDIKPQGLFIVCEVHKRVLYYRIGRNLHKE